MLTGTMAIAQDASAPTAQGPPTGPIQPASGPPTTHAKQDEPSSKDLFESLFVHGAYTIIPLPAVAYTRNERYWVGTVVPILTANPTGELEYILAPNISSIPSLATRPR